MGSMARKGKKGAADAATESGTVDVSKSPQTASMFCDRDELPSEFVNRVRMLEDAIGKQVWLFVHGESNLVRFIHPGIHREFVRVKGELPKRDMALLVHSYGGNAEAAFRISSLLRRECGGFTAIVPRVAKSAATLLVLGAETIMLGDDADLGPLDAQFPDYDQEEDMVSALDTVQAVEQLGNTASEVAVKMLRYLQVKTRKKYNLLLEHALHFAADVTKPLFEKIDAVRYSRQQRMLKEAQDYAERLLQPKFSEEQAKAIARDLVTKYPTHGFVIDFPEAKRVGVVSEESHEERTVVGLHVAPPPNTKAKEAIDWLYGNLSSLTAFGKLVNAKKPS
jgi:hypothetical protein